MKHRFLLVLGLAFPLAAQYTPPSGGGSSAAGTSGAIQYSNGGVLGGNAASQFINNTAITPPAAPAVVATCAGTCASPYRYTAYFDGLAGRSAPSAESVAVNNAVDLDVSHFNTITSPTCPTGITQYDIYRTHTAGYPDQAPGFLAQQTCGTPVVDTGAFLQYDDGPQTDHSTGTFLKSSLTVLFPPAPGVVASPSFITFGIPDQKMGEGSRGSFRGTTQAGVAININTAAVTYPFLVTRANLDGGGADTMVANQFLTSGLGYAYAGILFDGYEDFAGEYPAGASTASYTVYHAVMDVQNAGSHIGTAIGYAVFLPDMVPGSIVDTYKGIEFDDRHVADQPTQPTIAYDIWSDAAINGTARWFIYGSGTAPSHFGGPVDFAGAGAANTVVCWKAGGVIGWASNTAGVIGTTCN